MTTNMGEDDTRAPGADLDDLSLYFPPGAEPPFRTPVAVLVATAMRRGRRRRIAILSAKVALLAAPVIAAAIVLVNFLPRTACSSPLGGCGSQVAGTQVAPSATPGRPASAADSGRIGSGGRGWVATADRIRVTRDGGKTFSALASLPVPTAKVADVAVLTGSVQIATIGSSGPGVFSSADGGARWSELPVAAASGPAGAAQFVEDRSGVVGLQVTEQTSSNFSSGEWFAPQSDGTWARHTAPAGGTVSSTGPSLWLVGGPQADSLFRSVDKGSSWTPVSLPKECRPGGGAYAPPHESDGGVLMLAVNTPGGTGGEATLLSCVSSDLGASWHSSASTTVVQALEPGVPVASGVGGNTLWFVLPDATRVVRAAVDGTVSAVSPNGLPAGVQSVSAMSDLAATVTTSTTSCPTGKASCTTIDGVFETSDGGQTWTQLTAP
jgi:hypothetical protein